MQSSQLCRSSLGAAWKKKGNVARLCRSAMPKKSKRELFRSLSTVPIHRFGRCLLYDHNNRKNKWAGKFSPRSQKQRPSNSK